MYFIIISLFSFRLKPNSYYSPDVQQLYLFIVDEFETEDLNDINFPYITSLVKNGDACFSNYKQQPFSTATQKLMVILMKDNTLIM